MTALQLVIWSLLMLIGFAGSALYSGMETGAYSLNRIRLHVLKHEHKHAAIILHHLLDRPATLLTTLLIGNNVTNYLGTAALGVILASMHLGDWEEILLNALIVTPVLFIVGETLPKDLFAAHSDKWMYRLAPVLRFSRLVFTYTGLVPLISLFSSTLMKAVGQRANTVAFHPRRQVGLLVQEGVGYGILSKEQSAMIDRVLGMSDIAVRDEMTPWSKVQRLRETDGYEAVRHIAERMVHAHVPVLDADGRVTGLLRLNDVLALGEADCPPIKQLIKPALTVTRQTPISEALARIRQDAAGLAIVTGKAGQPVGVVTVKDLIEPITGDLRQW